MYKRNFLELLVKIVNYSALKGLGRIFKPKTLYINGGHLYSKSDLRFAVTQSIAKFK